MTYLKCIFGFVLACYAAYGIRSVVTPPVVVTQCCPAPKPKPKVVSPEMSVVALANQERVKRGLQPLKVNQKMMADAERWSMVQAKTRMHHSRMGYAENVAFGQPTPYAVNQAWINSRGHRRNMLNPSHQNIGVGLAYSAGGRPYWTEVFN